jgi:hypothetical protein
LVIHNQTMSPVRDEKNRHSLIATFQNTNAIPEMPFPKGPPPAPAPTAAAH